VEEGGREEGKKSLKLQKTLVANLIVKRKCINGKN
jgi:hypothetical protein